MKIKTETNLSAAGSYPSVVVLTGPRGRDVLS